MKYSYHIVVLLVSSNRSGESDEEEALSPEDLQRSLADLKLRNGDTLICREKGLTNQ